MSNSFYNHGAFPSTGSAATSASMRAELDLVAAGFDKMPTLAGNANKFIVVNSTGTGLTQTDVLPAFTVTDTDFTVQDDGDNTRKFQFNAGSITTGNTRVYVMPDLDTTLVGTNVTQTLTNKTLTAPVIATIVNTGTLTLPTSTDTLVGRNTTDTLTNKTLTNPVIGTIVNTGTLTLPTSTDTLVGRQTTDTLTNKTISGASNTLSNIANGSLSNSSVVIGSSTLSLGGTLTTLAGVTISGASNTLSNIANASLTNSSITINGSTVALGSSVTVTATATNALTIGNGLSGTSYNGSSAVTIAINTGVTADLSTAQTFSNKTISGSANTLTNIANASLTNSAITIGSTAISLGATSLTLAGLTSASATTLISTGNQATSVAISAIGHSSGTVTVTTGTAHGLTTGDTASIDGVADYTFCGVYTVTVTNANVFTYSQTASGASSSGGFSTKLTGTWGLYAGGTGPSLANGPVMINASSQLPALRVTQGGSGYALIVEDAANPDTSAFIISNAGDLTINTNKFTVAAASGNTVIGGTTSFGGNIVSNVLFTDATYDIGATGANRPRDLFLSRNLVVGGTLTLAGGVNLNGNVTIGDASTDTLTINSTITSNLIFTDNTYDIGASGATRPRNLYLAGLLTMGGALSVTGATTLTGALNANGNVTLGDAAADTVTVNGTITSNLIFTDNTYDIGASGATRPRNLYLSNTATIGGGLTVAGNTFLGDSSSDTLNLNGTAINLNTVAEIYGNGSQTTSIQTTLGITAQTSGTAGAGFGTSLGFNAEGSDGSNYALTTIDSYWSDATPATRTSVMDFGTRVNAGSVIPRLSIAGNGTFTFKNVGSDSGGTKMTLNSTGLGIGTAPVSQLHIEAASAESFQIGYSASKRSRFGTTSAGDLQIYAYETAVGYHDILLATDAGTSAGKVGIGLSPTYLFDVAKRAIGTIARFGGDDTGANSRGLTIASSTTTYIGDTFTLNAPSNGGSIILQTFNTNALYIDNGQQIGFGQNPSSGYRIAVNGFAQFNNSSGDEYLNVISSASGGRNWNIGSVANSSSISPPGCFAFRDSTIGETRMWIRGDAWGVNIGGYVATKTPWNAFTAYDIKNGMSSLSNFNSADTFLNHQVYYDGNWKFSTTGQSAATVDIFSNTDGGAYEFRVATTSNASVTAGNTVTWSYPLMVNKFGIALGNTTYSAPTSGTGIRFPPTQNNSSNVNTLDDYEEGTWTPVPRGSISAGTSTDAGSIGTYTKIGRIVMVTMVMYRTSFTGTGDFEVIGLPFPITDNVATGAVQFNANPFSGNLTVPNQITAMFFDGGSTISFRASDTSVSGGGYAQLQCRGSGGFSIEYLRFSCTYQTST
jgi:hypothetical protein